MKACPFITPLYFVIKHLLLKKNLANPYYGGLSSYPLLILLINYFQVILQLLYYNYIGCNEKKYKPKYWSTFARFFVFFWV